MIKKFVDFLLEYKKEDVELVKSMSDHFTLAIEYEICSTENPEEEPPVEDIEKVLEKTREQTLLDLSRGKIGYGYKKERKFNKKFFEENEKKMYEEHPEYSELKGKKQKELHYRYVTWTYIEDLLDNLDFYVTENWEDVEDDINTLLDEDFAEKYGKNSWQGRIVTQLLDRYLYNLGMYGHQQNFPYLIQMIKKHLPNFYEKYADSFKYELEGDVDKPRIIEFSPKTYIEGINSAMKQLDDFYDDLDKQNYWEFNNRTALHVNVGVKDRNIEWNPIKGLVMMGDINRDKKTPFVFKGIMHRLNNRFCGSLLDSLKRSLSGELAKDWETTDPIARINLGFRRLKNIQKQKQTLLDNIDKLDLHNLKEFEDFFNPFLIEANYDFYIKEFGIKITEIENGYVEFRFVGGGKDEEGNIIGIDRETIKDKLLYFCYIVYLMTTDYKKEDYHKKVYKFVDEIKEILEKD